ncbi:(Lyso)-N-acylphosphatidylethanolamine lipase [Folsomia candida]|uniref:Abhydrolase domain-containing protein 4 n=1 Tax=Folsomia candida TaxID=158441 RepID=A0A226ETL9_FOLCA|nr:(Lyso)-N-acylphosphatidylethanolamine lipase [Folsomia candida]OXA60953.1 Abhydrolase domain-containing protein 4 [Folsomia candida]
MSGNNQNYNTIVGPNNIEEIRAHSSRRRFGLRWIPTSAQEFEDSEIKLLNCLNVPYEIGFVNAGQVLQPGFCCGVAKLINVKIRTLVVNKTRPGTPLLLLHGLGLGIGCFVPVIRAVGQQFRGPIYALDLPGFGLSTRFNFPTDPKETEETYIKLLEGWRHTLNLQRVFIGGHSFGGFLATSYALKYQDRVQELVLFDPWGFPEKPEKVSYFAGFQNPFVIHFITLVTERVNVNAHFRLLGPWGPKSFASAIETTWSGCSASKLFEIQSGLEGSDRLLSEYMYHCIAGNPSGEAAFRSMMNWLVYTKEPMARRLHRLNTPVTMLYPEDHSFVPSIPDDELECLIGPLCRLKIIIIPSRHHENMLVSKTVEDVLLNLT